MALMGIFCAGDWTSAEDAAQDAQKMGGAGGTGLSHGAPAGSLGRGQVPTVVQAAIRVLQGQQVTSR